MKSDKIKVYQGQLIVPFGTPCIISASWETISHIHSESIAILFCMDGKIELAVVHQQLVKNTTHVKTIEDGVNHGFSMAYDFIPKLMWNFSCRISSGVRWRPDLVKIELKEVEDSELVLLSQIKRKDNNLIEFLETHVKSDLLKSLVSNAKDMDIQVSEYPQNDI